MRLLHEIHSVQRSSACFGNFYEHKWFLSKLKRRNENISTLKTVQELFFSVFMCHALSCTEAEWGWHALWGFQITKKNNKNKLYVLGKLFLWQYYHLIQCKVIAGNSRRPNFQSVYWTYRATYTLERSVQSGSMQSKTHCAALVGFFNPKD